MKTTSKSPTTIKYSRLSALFLALSIICLLVPVLVYLVMGFIEGSPGEKATLGICVVIAAILTVVNIIFKYHIRSILWIMVLGVYFCIDNIMPLLLCVAISTILDEFLFAPLHKHYKSKAQINKEIDKRIT